MDLTASLNRVVLYEPRAYALFGAGHPFAAQPSVTLEQLAPEPLILFDTTPSTSYAMSLFEGRGLSPERPPPHARLRAHALPRRTQPRVLRDPRAAAGDQAELRGAAHHRARARAGGAAVPGRARLAAGQQAVTAGARARGDRASRLRLVGLRSEAAGQPGAPVADATASRTAPAMTSGASADSTKGSTRTSPVAAQTTRSPSAAVALGAIARATPALPARATSHASRLSSRASVTRQTSVVFSRVAARAGASPASRRSVVRA